MGFFGTFWNWLNGQLTQYIGDNTARLAAALEPAVVTLATLYVMAWGYLQFTGRIEQPLVAGLRRIVTLAVVLGVGLQMWSYNSVIVDTFYPAPAQLAAAVIGSGTPVATIDDIWAQGGQVASFMFAEAAGHFINDFGFYLVGVITYVVVGLLCVYTMFLIALASIALAVLLALGPLFIVALLFDHSRRLFEAWIAQLTNYALITILTVMLASLLLQIVDHYAIQTATLGSAIHAVDVLDLLLVAVLVFLVLRQVMPIAAGLAGGATLHSMSTVSGAVRGAGRVLVGAAAPTTVVFGRSITRSAVGIAGVAARGMSEISGRVREEHRT